MSAVRGHRLIHDFMVVITAHGLFERHPGVRVASIETGVGWVPEAMKALRRLFGTGEHGISGTRLVDQFDEHVWVTPFTDDDVPSLLKHVPVERVLFGSDYPHAEGFAEPKQFITLLDALSADAQHRIVRDNARDLIKR